MTTDDRKNTRTRQRLVSRHSCFDIRHSLAFDSGFVIRHSSFEIGLPSYASRFDRATIVQPDSVGSGTNLHLIVGGGKEGKIYLVNRDNMGRFNAADDSQIVQVFQGIANSFSTPAYFNNMLYYVGGGDTLKAFRFSGGLLVTTPASHSATTFGWPGATSSRIQPHAFGT